MVSRSEGTDRVTVLAAVAVAALALAAPGAALASNHATVTVSDVTVTAGETATATLSLTEAPSGLSGFNVTVTAAGDAVSITDVSYPDAYGLSRSSLADDGASANVRGVDVQGNVESGAGPVVLANLTVRGESVGDATLSPTGVNVDDDEGGSVDPATGDGAITVAPESTPTATARPTTARSTPDQSTEASANGGQTPTEADGGTASGADTDTATEPAPTDGEGGGDDGSLSPLWLLGGGGIVAAAGAVTRLHFVWGLTD